MVCLKSKGPYLAAEAACMVISSRYAILIGYKPPGIDHNSSIYYYSETPFLRSAKKKGPIASANKY